MDSMDWFKPDDDCARTQVKALHNALKKGGKVLLRSAGRDPWYIKSFEEAGFVTKRAAVRLPGAYTDR